jgi:hypothetical protein
LVLPGRICGGVGEAEFKLDWSQFAEVSLAPPAVVDVLDAADDRVGEFVRAPPTSSVELVLLQQEEQEVHRDIVGGGGDRPHRCGQELALSKAGSFWEHGYTPRSE